MALASGHKAEVLQGEEWARLRRDWKGYTQGAIRLTPGPWIFPKPFLHFADKYYKFQFRSSDVVIETYPKCGTTWVQEIVWTMQHNPDLTHPLATHYIVVRSPFLELDMLMIGHASTDSESYKPFMERLNKLCPGKDPKDGMSLQLCECTPDPRIIKTHLSFSLLPPSLLDTCKVVYVARNPKDMLVSFHHHCRLMKVVDYRGTWEDFVQYFVDDNLLYGTYAVHLKEAWQKRTHPNLHIIFYEDLKADVMGELKRLDAFLGTKLTSQQLEGVARHTSFKEMKKRFGDSMRDPRSQDNEVMKQDGGFFRKGEAGDWKSKFSLELSAKVDAWIEKNIKGIDVDFKYSI